MVKVEHGILPLLPSVVLYYRKHFRGNLHIHSLTRLHIPLVLEAISTDPCCPLSSFLANMSILLTYIYLFVDDQGNIQDFLANMLAAYLLCTVLFFSLPVLHFRYKHDIME